ncbi:MAG: AsmA-like C-terminal region-containing protein [Bacteroidota bacterium]
MKLIQSIITGILFSVFIVISVSFIISFVYEDEISEIFLEEFNKRIKADIQSESINLSLLHKFPGASVELKEFSLKNYDGSDTLLNFTAERVFFQFDIIDIFTKDLSIERITADNGEVFIQTNKSVDIQEKSSKKSNINLNLEKLTFNDFNYSIINKNKALDIKGRTKKTTLSGNISSNNKLLNIDSDSFINFLKINNFPYIQDKNIQISSTVHATPDLYAIEKGAFKLENLPFAANGKILRDNNTIELEMNGKNIKTSDLQLYMPWEFKQKFKNLTIHSGRLDLLAKVNGGMKKSFPNIEIDFSLSKGKIEIDNENSLNFKDIIASGYFTNGRYNSPSSSYLVFNNLSASSGKSKIKSSAEIYNFLNPTLKTKGSADIILQTLTETIQLEDIENPSGSIEANFSLETPLGESVEWLNLIDNNKLEGDITFSRGGFQYKKINVEELNGFIYLKNSIINTDNLNAIINKQNDLSYTGTIQGLSDHLRDSTKNITLKGNMNGKSINIDSLFNASDTNATLFNKDNSINSNINLNFNEVKWGRFSASSLNGAIIYGNNSLALKSIDCKTLGGNMKIDAELTQNKDQSYQLKSQSFLDNIDINRAFQVFNDFGQNYITKENINGKISGEIIFSSDLSPKLKVERSSMHNISDFIIHDGELYNFSPLNSLSRFVDVSELKHVRFSTLKNKITIKDKVVYIPAMEINSSALDLNLEGYHHFDGEYRYRINLLLSEILSKKANQDVTKFGTIEDDGVGNTRLFLIMENVEGESKIKYDKKSVRDKIKKDIQSEKTELKQILFEEFGLFKNDTSIGNYEKKEMNEFKIQWEEEDKRKNKKENKQKKESEFQIKWEEDTLNRK